MGQHPPVQAIQETTDEAATTGVDVFISMGGGSPIDSVKVKPIKAEPRIDGSESSLFAEE